MEFATGWSPLPKMHAPSHTSATTPPCCDAGEVDQTSERMLLNLLAEIFSSQEKVARFAASSPENLYNTSSLQKEFQTTRFVGFICVVYTLVGYHTQVRRMQYVLPYTTNSELMVGCEKMKLINPNSVAATGPFVNRRESQLVQGGLLHHWDFDAAQAFLSTSNAGVETWSMRWSDGEAHWERQVHGCSTPEEVEALLPAKWIGYRAESDVDETLARVCNLCTALVDRFVQLSTGDHANTSTAKWRQRQALYERLGAVMELLEASIGEAIPILRLKDAEFVRQCWSQLLEEERNEMVAALGHDPVM